MILNWNPEPALYCWVKCPCAMMIIRITVSTSLSAVSLKSKRMNLLTDFCATNILLQRIEKRTKALRQPPNRRAGINENSPAAVRIHITVKLTGRGLFFIIIQKSCSVRYWYISLFFFCQLSQMEAASSWVGTEIRIFTRSTSLSFATSCASNSPFTSL